MVFSDTTNKNGIIQVCEDLLDLQDGEISGDATLLKKFTNWANIEYHKVVTMIFAAQDGWNFDDPNHGDTASFPKSFNTVADTQTVDLDTLTNKILRVNRVEVKYSTDGQFYKAEPINIGEIGLDTDPDNISGRFDKTEPFYSLQGETLTLWPTPDASVTGGLKVWYAREVDEFTSADTTQEPGFDEPFHMMLPLGASIVYAQQKGKENLQFLKNEVLEYEQRLKQYYGQKNEDRHWNLRSAFVNYE